MLQAFFASCRLFLFLALGSGNACLEGCTSGKLRHGGRSNLDLFSGLRVLAFAGGTSGRLERTETDEAYTITLGNGFNDCFNNGIQGLAGSNLGLIGTSSNGIDQFRLVHIISSC